MRDSGKWIHGETHSQCRAGSINSDSAVPESKAFLMEESVKNEVLSNLENFK